MTQHQHSEALRRALTRTSDRLTARLERIVNTTPTGGLTYDGFKTWIGNHGHTCPYCVHPNVVRTKRYILNDDQIIVPAACAACDAKWDEVYTLTAINVEIR